MEVGGTYRYRAGEMKAEGYLGGMYRRNSIAVNN